MRTLSDMIQEFLKHRPEMKALKIKNKNGNKEVTYKELYGKVRKLSSYLITLGLKKGSKVAIFSDNRPEWMYCDLSCQLIGLIDVPRGSNISEGEIDYISSHAEIEVAYIENLYVYKKIMNCPKIKDKIKKFIIFDLKEDISDNRVIKIEDAMSIGKRELEKNESQITEMRSLISQDDVATIIYTSGTTGLPKGVMLTHKNIISNIVRQPEKVKITEGDKFLAILPTWHTYERTVEYVVLFIRGKIIYSKPAPSILLKDFAEENPQYLTSVPRVWEALYEGILKTLKKQGGITYFIFKLFRKVAYYYFKNSKIVTNQLPIFNNYKIYLRYFTFIFNILFVGLLFLPYKLGEILLYKKLRLKLGKSFKAGISGGGALPKQVDDFFNSLGITVLEGYGLTETAPIVAVRDIEKPIYHSIGALLPDTYIDVRDADGVTLKDGNKGVLWVKGPQVMKGYYKNQESTDKVLKDGWFNTGDIGIIDYQGRIKITGRAKNTIVLLGGENIEPEPIEEKLKESVFIKTAVVLGQDKRQLSVLVILDSDNLKSEMKHLNDKSDKEVFNDSSVQNLIKEEIKRLVSIKNGFKRYELIANFKILENDFEVGEELTHTLKIKRNIVYKKYKKEIEKLFERKTA